MVHAPARNYVATDFFEGAAMLLTFILLGKWLEARASVATASKLTSLAALAPASAALVGAAGAGKPGEGAAGPEDLTAAGHEEEVIDARLIHIGDVLRVRPGAQVPADGTLLQVQIVAFLLPPLLEQAHALCRVCAAGSSLCILLCTWIERRQHRRVCHFACGMAISCQICSAQRAIIRFMVAQDMRRSRRAPRAWTR